MNLKNQLTLIIYSSAIVFVQSARYYHVGNGSSAFSAESGCPSNLTSLNPHSPETVEGDRQRFSSQVVPHSSSAALEAGHSTTASVSCHATSAVTSSSVSWRVFDELRARKVCCINHVRSTTISYTATRMLTFRTHRNYFDLKPQITRV